jgi:hypothetical protein
MAGLAGSRSLKPQDIWKKVLITATKQTQGLLLGKGDNILFKN